MSQIKKETQMSLSKDEMTVIETLRAKPFQQLTIDVNDGRIVLIRVMHTIKPENNKKSSH